jgi:DNA-binding transcriptional LysR family regulator
MMDVQTLRAFVAVAREGNVSRAAEKLSLTQPAVSLQLKALAEKSGLQLFTRTPQGMLLTPDGAALLPQAEKVLAALSDFGKAAKSLKSTVRGTLRIGTILDPEFIRLGAFLRELVDTAPHIATELRHGMSGEVLAQVAAGELDVGFYLSEPQALPSHRIYKENRAITRINIAQAAIKKIAKRSPNFAWATLSHFHYRVLAPAGWGPQVLGRDWRGLAALPWIETPPASAHHRLLRSVFEPLGVKPERVALVDQEASMLDLVKSGVGLSLVRDAIAIAQAQAHGLVIADRVSLAASLSFVCLQSQRDSAVVQSAFAALSRAWR